MTKPQIIEEKPMPMIEVKAALNKIKKRDGELSFRGNKTEEYLGQFVTVTKKKHDEIKKAILDLGIPRLKDEHLVKILDLMPRNVEDVKFVLQGFTTLTVSQDNIKKIAKVMADMA